MDEQIIKELKELNTTVGNINTKVEVQNQRMVDFLSRYANDQVQNKAEHLEIKTKQDQTNGRVKSLEKWKWSLAGGLAVIVVLLGWLFNFVKAII